MTRPRGSLGDVLRSVLGLPGAPGREGEMRGEGSGARPTWDPTA